MGIINLMFAGAPVAYGAAGFGGYPAAAWGGYAGAPYGAAYGGAYGLGWFDQQHQQQGHQGLNLAALNQHPGAMPQNLNANLFGNIMGSIQDGVDAATKIGNRFVKK